MNEHATVPYIEVESSLGAVLERLEGHEALPLFIEYDDQVIQPGYHITEVKAGSFVTLVKRGARPTPIVWHFVEIGS